MHHVAINPSQIMLIQKHGDQIPTTSRHFPAVFELPTLQTPKPTPQTAATQTQKKTNLKSYIIAYRQSNYS